MPWAVAPARLRAKQASLPMTPALVRVARMNTNDRVVPDTFVQSIPTLAHESLGPALCQRDTSTPSGRGEGAAAAGSADSELRSPTATARAASAELSGRTRRTSAKVVDTPISSAPRGDT